MLFVYRKTGGEVIAQVSTALEAASFFNPTYLALTPDDPPTPDGIDLSVSKIWDGTSVRNATPTEITACVAAALADEAARARAKAVAKMLNDPAFRKIFGALLDLLVNQFNVLRTQPTTTFAAITKAQARTAWLNAINDGSND